jgi:hypothetical protein
MVADMSGSFDKEDDGLESGRDEEVGMSLGSLARSSDASDNFFDLEIELNRRGEGQLSTRAAEGKGRIAAPSSEERSREEEEEMGEVEAKAEDKIE